MVSVSRPAAASSPAAARPGPQGSGQTVAAGAFRA